MDPAAWQSSLSSSRSSDPSRKISRRVGLGAKLKFYKSLVLPRLMYGAAESWALTEAQGAQLETLRNGCLRQMMGLHRGPDGPSTAELLAI